MQKLSELSEGTKGRITSILGNAHFQSRITSIGLTVGSQIEIIQNPKKQPVLIYGRDAFAVSVCKGLSTQGNCKKAVL